MTNGLDSLIIQINNILWGKNKSSHKNEIC